MSETVKDLIRRVREHIDAGITAGHGSAVTPDDFLRRDCHYSLCLSYGELRVLLDYIAEVERSWDEDKNVLASALAAARAQVEVMRSALVAAQEYLPLRAPDACDDCPHDSCERRRTELRELHATIRRALAAQEGA